MNIFSLINLLTYCYLVVPNTIIIDVTRSDKLSLSEITEKVTPIPLKGHSITPKGIQKVFIIEGNIYVLQRYKELEISYSHLFKYNISGNYKGEIEVKDPASKEKIEILDMQYDDMNKRIFLLGLDGYGIFDNAGNFLSYSKRARTEFEFLFKKHFWSVAYSHKNGIGDYSLVHTDLDGQNKDTIKSIKYKFPAFLVNNKVFLFAAPHFSVLKNELYVSFGIDNTIYKVDQQSLTPVHRLEFKNRPPSDTDILLTPGQLIFSRYVKCGYFMKGSSYYLLYDKKNGKSYNIKYAQENNKQPAGIEDDIFHTGYLNIVPTNVEDYVFFFRKREDLKGNKMFDPKNIDPTIFLVKLKI